MKLRLRLPARRLWIHREWNFMDFNSLPLGVSVSDINEKIVTRSSGQAFRVIARLSFSRGTKGVIRIVGIFRNFLGNASFSRRIAETLHFRFQSRSERKRKWERYGHVKKARRKERAVTREGPHGGRNEMLRKGRHKSIIS